jgi:hypothetical protein
LHDREQVLEPTDRGQFGPAHAVVVAGGDGDIQPHLVFEVLYELRDIGGCDIG